MTIKDRVLVLAHILKDTWSDPKPKPITLDEDFKKLKELLSQHMALTEALVSHVGRLDGGEITEGVFYHIRTVHPGGPLYAQLKESVDRLVAISNGIDKDINRYYFNVKDQEK